MNIFINQRLSTVPLHTDFFVEHADFMCMLATSHARVEQQYSVLCTVVGTVALGAWSLYSPCSIYCTVQKRPQTAHEEAMTTVHGRRGIL